MPYASNDDLPAGVKNNLPASAQTVYRKAFNAAYEGTCKGDDGCASRVGWSAVKKGFEKGEDGKWHRKSFVEFTLVITKAVYDKTSNKYRFVATASDTDPDSYGERMTVDLFRDFIRRADTMEKPPEQFCSEYWSGGLPYMSVAHYSDLNGEAVPGKVTKVYVDGKQLKAHGEFFDTPLGRACFKSICNDLYSESKSEDKVRISIGFLDYAHAHGTMRFERKQLSDRCPMCLVGVGDKAYLSGHLIHLAMTRVPVNRRTDIEPELEEKAMAITRKEDAASIVGEELAEDLEEKSKLVGKSEAESDAALVERAEEECEGCDEAEASQEPVEKADTVEVAVEKMDGESAYMAFGGAKTFEEVEQYEATMEDIKRIHNSWWILENLMGNILMDEACTNDDKKKYMTRAVNGFKSRLEAKAMTALARMSDTLEDVQPHPLDEAISALKSAYDAALGAGGDELEVLQALQEPYAQLGNVLRSNVQVAKKSQAPATEAAPAVEQTVPHRDENLEALRSDVQLLKEQITLLTNQLSGGAGVKAVRDATPPRKNLAAQPEVMAQIARSAEEKTTSLKSLCRKSVGLL